MIQTFLKFGIVFDNEADSYMEASIPYKWKSSEMEYRSTHNQAIMYFIKLATDFHLTFRRNFLLTSTTVEDIQNKFPIFFQGLEFQPGSTTSDFARMLNHMPSSFHNTFPYLFASELQECFTKVKRR